MPIRSPCHLHQNTRSKWRVGGACLRAIMNS
jgi:hypothetical protein